MDEKRLAEIEKRYNDPMISGFLPGLAYEEMGCLITELKQLMEKWEKAGGMIRAINRYPELEELWWTANEDDEEIVQLPHADFTAKLARDIVQNSGPVYGRDAADKSVDFYLLTVKLPEGWDVYQKSSLIAQVESGLEDKRRLSNGDKRNG